MRSSILLGFILLSEAIGSSSPRFNLSGDTMMLAVVLFLVFIIMDLIDFFKGLTKK